MTVDPRIVSLDGAAEAAANEWSPFSGLHVQTVRESRHAMISIGVRGPARIDAQGGWAHAWLGIDQLDELLRELLAVRADLVKLLGGKS